MSMLYVDQSTRSVGRLDDALLAGLSERHHFRIPPIRLARAEILEREIEAPITTGVVFALTSGLPSGQVMRLVRLALKRKRAVFLYWPAENAIEVVDHERYRSLVRHRLAYQLGLRLIRWIESRRRRAAARASVVATAGGAVGPAPSVDLTAVEESLKFIVADFAGTNAHLGGGFHEVKRIADLLASIDDALGPLRAELAQVLPEAAHAELDRLGNDLAVVRVMATNLVSHMEGGQTALSRIDTNLAQLLGTVDQLAHPTATPVAASAAAVSDLAVDEYRRALKAFAASLAPIPFDDLVAMPAAGNKIKGTGVYVRTAYWTHLVSGGSYGHTCYVADELAKVTEKFLCLMGARFPLLDDLGIPQTVIAPQLTTTSERDLLVADQFYYNALRQHFLELRPAYIYERLVLGNFAAARLSRELGIPYIVEYNGSEISMSRSFGSGALAHEDLFIEAERLAFEQATVITAISEHVRDDIVRRGIDSRKVLVNPNGVNCSEYQPPTPEEKREIREALGLSPEHRVIGFVGTFGGWHGIDVLAAALEPVCRTAPNARFLLIGDGNLKHLVTEAIKKHGLQEQVIDVGRTEQRQGAQYLKAADIYVSPHSSHMTDSRFFGSPTKLFEYMALAGGIVASDLEQIGELLAPSLRAADFQAAVPAISNQRAVLCRPGDVDDFIAAVLALVAHPDIGSALGRNARAAAIEHFSWERHVARIWDFGLGLNQVPSWRATG